LRVLKTLLKEVQVLEVLKALAPLHPQTQLHRASARQTVAYEVPLCGRRLLMSEVPLYGRRFPMSEIPPVWQAVTYERCTPVRQLEAVAALLKTLERGGVDLTPFADGS